MTKMTNFSKGLNALETFYEQSISFGTPLPFESVNDFIKYLKSHNDRGYKILHMTLNNSIQVMYDEANFLESWSIESDVDESMTRLAKLSQGKLPNAGAFVQALANQFSNLRLTPYFEAVEETLTSLENVGKGVLTTMNLSRWAIPALVIGGAGMFIYYRAKRA